MTTKDEALKQALDALETCTPGDYSTGHIMNPWYDEWGVEKAIAACRAALAQKDEQEPVAWMFTSKYRGNEWFFTRYPSELMVYKADKVIPLYTAPPDSRGVISGILSQ